MRHVSSEPGWQAASDAARSLVVWRAPQLQFMADALQAQCLSWADAWGLDLPRQPSATCSRARGRIEGPWLPLVQEQGAGAWIDRPPPFDSCVARRLVGVEMPNTPVAAAVVGSCLEDLHRRLAGAGGWLPCPSAADSATAPQPFARWSEGVLALLPLGLRLLFDAAAAKTLLKRCPAPVNHGRSTRPSASVSVASAVADFPMRLRVQLEACELDLRSLRELQVGDVLRLRHRIETPASVRTAGGNPVFSGFLVRSRGRKAVELAPAIRGDVTRGAP